MRNRARFKGVAGLAARFGKMRGDVLEDREGGEGGENDGFGREGEGGAKKGGRCEAWERVERMEEEWTRRLIGGESLHSMAGREEDREEKRKENSEVIGKSENLEKGAKN